MARGTFGERLKRERKLRKVPLEEITQATRIGSRFLQALENEDWEKLLESAKDRRISNGLSRLARWASLREVRPADIDSAMLEGAAMI